MRPFAVAMVAAVLAPLALQAQGATDVARVAWLAGCWELRTPTRVVEEYWMAPRGGSMLGMARTVVRDSLTEYESTVIRAQGGRLVYDATPSGQTRTVFPAITATTDSVVFELKEHDFPQRIGYARRGADSLVAWIEGTMGGKSRHIPFGYKRAACPSR